MHISRSFLAATAAVLLLSPPAMAQEVSLDTVVATVNGDAITMAHVLDIKRQLPDEYQNIPDATLFQGIIDQLIQQTVMAQATPTPPSWIDVALQNQRRIIMSSQHIAQLQGQAVTEDALKAAYDATYANAPAQKEYHAAHILVETREQAAALVAEARGGADFAELAKAHSTGPSGPRGGDLGWFGRGQMVPPFEAAVVQMAVGDISEPVETQFGWHVIKLEETRDTIPPSFEQVRGELAIEIQNAAITQALDNLMNKATVTRAEGIDPSVLSTLRLSE